MLQSNFNAIITYINSSDTNALDNFSETLESLIKQELKHNDKNEIVILCIGTDRATGDSLGPIIGYKFKNYDITHENVYVYGSLENPVHAGNLNEYIKYIDEFHKNGLVIAIDASLGKIESIGSLMIGKGNIKPGAAMNKSLPGVGHIFISGIVNYIGKIDIVVLQNTRLNIVMQLADLIFMGFIKVLKDLR